MSVVKIPSGSNVILDLRLEGYTREEIAEKIGCAVSTVKRKLDVIRQTWLENES